MQNVFFISDQHFYHKNVIKYCDRPFFDVDEMNEVMIKRWNAKVTNKDIVYNLGDFSFYKTGEILDRLNGQKILIRGDHDKDCVKESYKSKWRAIHHSGQFHLKLQQFNNAEIFLNHYCMRSWKKSHWNVWHLYGHHHGRLDPIGKSWDVGVDVNNFEPLSFDEIKKIMNDRPNNPAYDAIRLRKEKDE